MSQSKRQLQVARVVQQYLSDIFLREGKEVTKNALVTISQVKMTPDLQVASVYLSLYNTEQPDEIMRHIKANAWQFRKLLGNQIRHQLRKVPELNFFKDDTLDEVFKLEEIFKELNEQKKDGKENGEIDDAEESTTDND